MGTLKRQEHVGEGLRRIACEAVEAGVRALTRPAGNAGVAAGAIREAAAALALIGPGLPTPTLRRDRALIERLSAGLDELNAPERLLNRLDQRYKKPPADAELAAAVKALRKRWSGKRRNGGKLNAKSGSFDPAIYRLVADMAELRGHIGNWPAETITSEGVPAGLRRSYSQARRRANPPLDDAALHALATAVGLMGVQLDLLAKACPAMIRAQRKLLNRAAESLDQLHADHTLDQLLHEQMSKPSAEPLTDPAERAKRIAAITTDLRTALAETPSAFSNRIGVYWSAWRGDV